MESAEDLVQMRVLAVVPHRLVVVHLDHADGADDVAAVPAVRVMWIGAGVPPDVVDRGLEVFLRHGVMHDHVTVMLDVVLPLGWTLWIVCRHTRLMGHSPPP